MKNILVSGASGIVGYGILRSLKASGKELRLIGTTIYEDSVAQGFCDIFEKAPLTTEPAYITWLKGIIERYQIDLLIPGIEADLYKWAEHITEIRKTDALVVMNNPDLVAICRDKWIFYERLIENDTALAIPTSIDTDFDSLAERFGLPLLLKPRVGYGSKGIVRINDQQDFLKYQSGIGEIHLVQPIIGNDDEEYSTSAFCDGKGGYYAIMTIKRKLSSEGFTGKAEVVELEQINNSVLTLCRIFKPVGPTNFQFRKQADIFKLLEINPRISSATSIRMAFGYNEAKMAVEYYLEKKEPKQPIIRRGRAVRYSEDFIFYENSDNI